VAGKTDETPGERSAVHAREEAEEKPRLKLKGKQGG